VRGKITGKFLIEAGGLTVIFFGGGIGGGFEEREGGGGLAGIIADQLGPGLRTGLGFEEEIGFSASFFCFRVLPKKQCDSGDEGKTQGDKGLGLKPDWNLSG